MGFFFKNRATFKGLEEFNKDSLVISRSVSNAKIIMVVLEEREAGFEGGFVLLENSQVLKQTSN